MDVGFTDWPQTFLRGRNLRGGVVRSYPSPIVLSDTLSEASNEYPLEAKLEGDVPMTRLEPRSDISRTKRRMERVKTRPASQGEDDKPRS